MRKYSFLLFLFSIVSYSQSMIDDINNYYSSTTLSSPDVYSFEKVNLSNIKKYVGKVDVTIPLYNIKSGNLTYPVNLSYDTGGIKVDQLASDVGLGWSLSRTLITRKINQGNDFNTIGYKGYAGSNYTFGSQLEQDLDLSLALNFKQQIGYFLNLQLNRKVNLNERKIDFIPDEYNFYSSEFNTKFFFQTLTNPIEINPQGTKINAVKSKMQFDAKIPYINVSTNQYDKYYDFPTEDFFSINITSNNGIKYTFNDYDLASNIVSSETGGVVPWHYSNNKVINLNTIYVSAWHISVIEDLQTGKKIFFEYDTTNSNPCNAYNATNTTNNSLTEARINSQRSFTYMKSSVDVNTGQCFYWTPYNPTMPYEVNSRIDVQKKRLKRIYYDEGSVEYKYNNDGGTISGISNIRDDVYNGDFLTKIIVKNNKGDIIKTIEFKYDYFTSNYGVGEFNPDGFNNPKRYKRLKLKEVQEIGKPAFVFTYDETIKLPPVNSFSIDFLGYYNASPDITNLSQIQSIQPNPKIWYYPNNFDKSVLPFPIPNQPVNLINGYFDRQANNNAKAWSLIRIDYPTGGFSKFEYESNSFKLFNENIIGGGIRIKKQFINDDFNNERVIEYSYLDDGGKSSGSLATIPYFGHPSNKFFDVSVDDQSYPPTIYSNNPVVIDLVNWKLFDKSNLNQDVVSGAYVGYSKVTEREIGKGRTEVYFTSNDIPEFQNRHYKFHPQAQMPFQATPTINNASSLSTVSCMTAFIMTNSAFLYDNFTDNGYKRGKLRFEKVYNETGQISKIREISYSDNLYNSYNFLQPITYPIRTVGDSNLGLIYKMIKKFEITNFFKTGEKIYNYSNGNELVQESIYNFNGIGLLTTKTDVLTNNTILNKFYYTQDNQVSTEPQISSLISKNMLSIPLKTEIFTNGLKTSEKKVVFANDVSTSNLLLPKYVFEKKGDDINGVLERKITGDLFDNKGNILQYTLENGVPVSFIWGYNKTLLIAKIENCSYNSISTALINSAQSASDTQTEAQLLTALNNIRNSLPNAMVTTYTHKPLVGINSVTDPKGDKISYEYDSNRRLVIVRDKDNKILSENEYFFQP